MLHWLMTYILPFLGVLTLLVFVHEFGHYIVARLCGVHVLTFSIGFGPELFGYTNKAGTRWKFSLLPLGGYVKMFGDANAASMPDHSLKSLTEAEKKVCFMYKNVWQRIAIIAAGPLANFVFAIVVFTSIYNLVGQPYTPPIVGMVQTDSAAEKAGILPQDKILEIDGRQILRFEDMQQIVRLHPGDTLPLTLLRDGKTITLIITPQTKTLEDQHGNSYKVGMLGIGGGQIEFMKQPLWRAFIEANRETGQMITDTLVGVKQLIFGNRSTEELGGPIRIAQLSSDIAKTDLITLLWFCAILSINLGLINLFPIPILDGGHLVFYGFEAILGKPLSPAIQNIGFRIGFALLLTLMLFTTLNDLENLKLFSWFSNLFSS